MIWDSLKTDDTLAIVQFSHRIPEWVVVMQNRIAKLLDISYEEVVPNAWANLCVYTLPRNGANLRKSPAMSWTGTRRVTIRR